MFFIYFIEISRTAKKIEQFILENNFMNITKYAKIVIYHNILEDF